MNPFVFRKMLRYALDLGEMARVIPGFLKHGLFKMKSGELRVGDMAPDCLLYKTDKTSLRLKTLIGVRPLVLIFGSYT